VSFLPINSSARVLVSGSTYSMHTLVLSPLHPLSQSRPRRAGREGGLHLGLSPKVLKPSSIPLHENNRCDKPQTIPRKSTLLI